MSLRIVHAAPFFEPAWEFGGPVAQLAEVCRLLAARGHDVRVLTSDLGIGPEITRDEWVSRNGYSVYYASAGRVGAVSPYLLPKIRPALTRLADGVDVIHTCLSFTHLNLLVRRFCLQHRIPYVYSPRSCLDPVRLRLRRLSKSLFLRLFERGVLRDASAIHVLTETERDQVLAQGANADRIRVIPNGVALPALDEMPDRMELRRELGFNDRSRLVLFLGRLHQIKGLDLLIEAFAAVRGAHADSHLIVAGPPEEGFEWLERVAREHRVRDAIRFTGLLSGRKKAAALRAADLFVLPSRSEGIPNAVLEACAHATPVLITPGCNLPEVAEFDAGRIEPADAARLGRALAEMLSGDDTLARMGQNGRRMVEQRFSFDHVIDELESMYRQLTSTLEERPATVERNSFR
jgi:glycosyltransferase involved in cell wall biosynthesis